MTNNNDPKKTIISSKDALKLLIGEKAAKPACLVKGFADKVLSDLALFQADRNPYQDILTAVEGLGNPEKWKITARVPDKVRAWVKETSVGCKLDGKYPAIDLLPRDFMVPTGKATKKDTEELLKLFQVPQVEAGVYKIISYTVDLNERIIGGTRYVMPEAISFGPMGGATQLDADTLLYIIVSMMCREAYSSGKGKAKDVRELLESIERCFDSPKVGYADGARKAIERNKPAVLKLIFDQFGFGVVRGKIKAENRGTTFSKVSAELPGMGAHPQGKYYIPFEQVGIDLEAPPVLPAGTSHTDGIMLHMRRRALVGSTDVTKWFKRLTLATPQQARLVEPDTGFMTTNGNPHEGKRTPVLVMPGGISLPYLGGAVAIVSRKEMGEHFAHYSEDIIEEHWPSQQVVGGIPTTSLVKKGDPIAESKDNTIYARKAGILLDRRFAHSNGETVVLVKVGEVDRDGQIKGRGPGGGKESFHYLHHTAPNWPAILATLGLEGDFINGGDLAISGLKPGERPFIFRNEDGNKAMGKGAASGRVALAAETEQEHIDYTATKDDQGVFEPLVKKFENNSRRMITAVWSVDNNTFEHVSKTVKSGKAHKGVCLYQVEVDGDMFYIVVQKAEAFMAYDLIKVESLPVADCLSTQRVQGEIVTGLNTCGCPITARSVLDGGKSQLAEYRRLQEVAWAHPVWLGKFSGAFLSTSGQQHDLITINLNAPIPESLVSRFLDLGRSKQSIMALDKPFAIGYWDEQGVESICAVVIDPTVLHTFGGGKDKSSCEQLTRMLLITLGQEDSTRDQGKRLVLRLRGVLQKLAKAAAVAKRVQRGSAAVNMRCRTAFVPLGWVAISYYGQAARELALVAGWEPKSDVRAGDFVAGLQAIAYRAPQFNVVPERIFCPDAPEEKIAEWKAEGKWPDGAKKYGDGRMEPSTSYSHPLAIATQHGDSDGDGRAFIIVTDKDALLELAAKDWETLRQGVLKHTYGDGVDPVIAAYEHDPAKLKWGSVKRTTLSELVGLTNRSITNQTLHIGSAYNHAHAALVLADLYGGGELTYKAFGLMIGHYEEQLAGLSETYYKFYEGLRNYHDPEVYANLAEISKTLGHTEADFRCFFKTHAQLSAAMNFKRGRRDYPELVLKGGAINWMAMTGLYSIIAYRAMSAGNLGDSIIRELVAHQTDNAIMVREVLTKLRGRSVVAEQIMRMIEVVMPEVSPFAFPNDMDNYIEMN